MRLTRLAVNELRQFGRPFELSGFQPGINVIAGANETGKSALVRALQAAFFERHGTRSVDDLRPWHDSTAAPEVQVDFECGGQQYRLIKRFLKKARCSLQVSAQNHDGEQAEDVLRELLGFQYPGKGRSREEYWGIPGLLWINQGTGQDLARPISHAHDFLRESLSQGLEELATSDGDSVVDAIAAERAVLLTGTGKPTGDLRKVTADAETARQALAEIEQKVVHYQQQVDRLAQVRHEWREAETAQPWDEAERKKAAAVRELEAVNRQREALTRSRNELKQAQSEQQLLYEQIRQWQQDEERLAGRETQVVALQYELDTAIRQVTALGQQLSAAAADVRAAEANLAQAEAARRRDALAATIAELTRAVGQSREQLKRAREEQAKRQELQQQLVRGGTVQAAAVEALVRCEEALRNVQMRREAVATRVRYRLEEGRTVTLGGQDLTGSGETTLIEPTVMHLPGIGEFTVEPGGEDLSALAARERDAQRACDARLAELGVDSVASARRRLADRQEAERQLQWLDRILRDLAPDGIDALEAELGGRAARLQQSEAELAALPKPDRAAPAADSATATLALNRQQHESIRQRQQQAREEEVAARTKLSAAVAEHHELTARIKDPQRQEKQQANRDRLLALGIRVEQLEDAIGRQNAAIDAANPQVLEDDIQRFGRAAEATRATQRDRQTEIARLEGELGAEGATGLEEQRAELRARAERLERRRQALELRANALDRLYLRLQGKRAELVERLQAPLQKHVAAYLRILFPEAELRITEAFQPGQLLRQGAAAVDFDALSFGAREQVGVILRLAYADALKEAGRPTLIVLDDALVHSDKPRREAMQRVLYNAAHRHQILLFTCHPDSWAELGVPMRALETLKAEAGL